MTIYHALYMVFATVAVVVLLLERQRLLRALAHRKNPAPGTLCLCLHPMQDHNEQGCRFRPCGCERFRTRRPA